MKKIIKISTILAGIIISSNAFASNAPKTLNIGILGGESATQQIGDNMCVKKFLDKELITKKIDSSGLRKKIN